MWVFPLWPVVGVSPTGNLHFRCGFPPLKLGKNPHWDSKFLLAALSVNDMPKKKATPASGPDYLADANVGGASDDSVAELQTLAEMLLLGWVDPKTGEHRYFKHGGRKERAARYAVAYLLRNPKPLDFYIRNRLADLLIPVQFMRSI